MKLTGWKKIGDAPVYEHENGTRVHACGMVRKSCGEHLLLNGYRFDRAMRTIYRRFGWNKRRAYIYYAEIMFCS